MTSQPMIACKAPRCRRCSWMVGLLLVLAMIFVSGVVASAAFAVVPAGGLTVRLFAPLRQFSEARNSECAQASGNVERCFDYQVMATDSGSVASEGPIVVKDVLPSGLSVSSNEFLVVPVTPLDPEQKHGPIPAPEGVCVEEGLVASGLTVKCTYPHALVPDEALELDLGVSVGPEAVSGTEDTASVTGAGSPEAVVSEPMELNTAAPVFGPNGLFVSVSGVDGQADVEAGGHPYEPSGYESVLRIPQPETPGTLATPPLKTAVVTLPAGVSISPSAAGGLVGCQETGPEGIDFSNSGPGSCPDASKVGTVKVVTPLIAEELQGSVFVAQPSCGGVGQPQCSEAFAEAGRLFAIYLEVGSKMTGVHLKLRGRVEVGGTGVYSQEHGLQPGQIRTSFIDTPQQPFSELKLNFNPGARAPLANPQSCGTFMTNASFEPWSAPASGPNAVMNPSFAITAGCGNGFAPTFSAGTVDNHAGAYSSFTTTFGRHDGEQDLSGLEIKMPEGLIGKIAGIAQCGEAEIKAAQADTGGCPAASKIGAATAAAGSGSDPYWQSGSVYLTGPYNNGPFGLVVVVPAVAGPFDLGNIVVRASIRIDPSTAQVSVLSDPLPQSVDGVPLRVQTVNVTVGLEGNFTFNPTGCTPSSITATITSAEGATSNVSSRFQAADCAALKFAPAFTASTQANGSSRGNGASLDVKVGYPQPQTAYSNIAKVDTQLPPALSSRLATLHKACSETQFAANPAGCPAGATVGTATVKTPALSNPLSGPAILVSHGGAAFPDLVLVLQGEGVTIDLVGNTDIKNGITYSKFEAVPDAPVSSFELNLPEKEDSILSAVKNLCAPTKTVTVKKKVTVRRRGKRVVVKRRVKKTEPESLVMPTTLTAQNGAVPAAEHQGRRHRLRAQPAGAQAREKRRRKAPWACRERKEEIARRAQRWTV